MWINWLCVDWLCKNQLWLFSAMLYEWTGSGWTRLLFILIFFSNVMWVNWLCKKWLWPLSAMLCDWTGSEWTKPWFILRIAAILREWTGSGLCMNWLCLLYQCYVSYLALSELGFDLSLVLVGNFMEMNWLCKKQHWLFLAYLCEWTFSEWLGFDFSQFLNYFNAKLCQ